MANIGLTLKGNAVSDEDSLLALRLLEPTCTETDTVITIRSATATKSNGQVVKAYTVPRKPSDFNGGSFDFSSIAGSIPANNFCYALVTISSVDQIEVVLGTPNAVAASASLPTTANYQVALVLLKKGALVLDPITNTSITDRRAVNQVNDQPIFFSTNNELVSEQYLAQVADNFVAYPNTADSSIDFDVDKTATSQYAAANSMTMQYSTRTGTITGGTGLVLASAPDFSVRVGYYVRRGSSFARITAVTNQTTYTLSSALTNGAGTFTVLEPIYTKDLVRDLGDLSQGTRLTDVYADDVSSVLIDYDDSAVVGDTEWDGGNPNVICLVANASIDTFVTALRPNTKSGTLVETFTTTPSNNLKLVFLPNLTSGSGTVNLLWYSCFLFKDPFIFNGGILNQSFAYTTSASGLNCDVSVSGDRTVITIKDNFPNYVMGVNTGTPFGDLIVEDFGIEIPRRTVGITDDNLPYYEETAYNKITLWENLSTTTRQITIKRRTGTQDISSENALKISVMYEAIVGSSAQVTAGTATHASLQTAIDAASAGSRILVLPGTYTENITLSANDIVIEGKGRSAVIDGNFTLSGSGNDVSGLKIGGNMDLTGSNYNFVKAWLASTSVFTAGGLYNSVDLIQE
jgi:hypothetical protein